MREKTVRVLCCTMLAGLVLLFFVSGYLGRDFGTHWDESQHVNSVVESVQTGTFLPQMYNYPSFCYWLVTSQVLPDVLWTIVDVARTEISPDAPSRKIPQLRLAGGLSEDELIIKSRVLCLGLTTLALVWTYLLVVVWQGRHWVALLSAAFLGGSFELSYHSRWVAPDAILMQFAVLLVMILFCAIRSETRRREWFVCAAIVFGLAMSVKYTAVFLIIPMMLVCFFNGRAGRIERFVDFSLTIIVAGVVFVLVTPGIYVQPVYFFSELMKQKYIYSSGYYGNTVSGVMEHLTLSLSYFSKEMFSPYMYISIFMFGCALIGIGLLFLKRQWEFLVFISAPCLYYVYFLTQKVMIVRNFLLLLPFFCVLLAFGVSCIIDRFPGRLWKSLVIAVIASVIAANFVWDFSAASSIRNRAALNLPYAVMSYLVEHPGEKILLSSAMQNVLRGKTLPSNVVLEPDGADWFVFANDEYPGITRMNFRANESGRYAIVAGARDVNVNYYPAWVQRKVLRVSLADARNMNLL